MNQLLALALSYPTVFFTIGLGVCVGFWVLVGFGALSLEVGEGGIDVDADVGGDVGTDVEADMDADVDAMGAAAGSGISLFSPRRLRQVPMTVAATLVSLTGWVASAASTHFLGGALASWLPASVAVALVGLAALAVALPLASWLCTPLAPLFATHEAPSRKSLVGQVVSVSTGRVDRSFGQALLEDGGAGLVVQVRADPERELGRGHKALIVSYSDADEAYEVEPMVDLLGPASRGSAP